MCGDSASKIPNKNDTLICIFKGWRKCKINKFFIFDFSGHPNQRVHTGGHLRAHIVDTDGPCPAT